jgi:alkanesulfonate monooxygenase SsuD/methylene tetrahydromethanopterin reductase-like flavin-dependent oxidoreductase (luciferase family)
MKLAFWGPTTKPPDGLSHVESYRYQLDEIVLAEEYGFDHYWLFEHHISPSSPSPSPNLMIAAAARMTRRIRLGTLVNILPYRHPLLVAEEMAMLDTLTEGRVDCGIGRGLKPYEFRAFGQDQEVSREVFTECLDVVRKVWADENFSHKGKYYTCEKNTPLSPPLVQKPHPPLYVSAQSPESIRWAASQDIPFGQIDALVDESRKDQKVYREIQMAHGFAPVPRLFVTRDVYVAASDEDARREAKPYLIRNWDLWNRYTQFTRTGQMPDSYDLWRKRAPMLYALSYEEIIGHGLILVGTPDTVIRTILDQQSQLDIAMMVLGFRFGGMPYDIARRSMHLFATEVMPELRRREADAARAKSPVRAAAQTA